MAKAGRSRSLKKRNPVAWALRQLKVPLPIRPKKGKGSYNRKTNGKDVGDT